MTKNRKYSVATFKLSYNDGDEDSLEYKSYVTPYMFYRDYVTLGENLSWEEVKKMQRENKNNWIF